MYNRRTYRLSTIDSEEAHQMYNRRTYHPRRTARDYRAHQRNVRRARAFASPPMDPSLPARPADRFYTREDIARVFYFSDRQKPYIPRPDRAHLINPARRRSIYTRPQPAIMRRLISSVRNRSVSDEDEMPASGPKFAQYCLPGSLSIEREAIILMMTGTSLLPTDIQSRCI